MNVLSLGILNLRMTNAHTACHVDSNRHSGVEKTAADGSIIAVSMVPVEELHPEQSAIPGFGQVLGVVTYAQGITLGTKFPVVDVELQQLEGEPLAEVWHSTQIPQYGAAGIIRYSKVDDFLFATIELECEPDLQKQTEYVYKELLSFVSQSGYPNLLRVWNHFPLINEFDNGTERYQLFCVGRHNAFRWYFGDNFQQQLPAASAIGTKGRKFSLHFISAAEPGMYLENQRQTSAYRYSQQYGQCSPSFARATLFSHSKANNLVLSGTASIVGHVTLHSGEPEKQLEETLRNIDALLQHESVLARQKHLARFTNVKVYLRHPAHLPNIKSRVTDYFGNMAGNMADNMSVVYLRGDICRGDLLLEIEGICGL